MRSFGAGKWNRAVLAALVLAVAASPAWGWGRVGHRASARSAEARLTPAAKAAIKDLLEPGETLADASTWPDEHRSEMPESGPWHYINVPITETKFDRKFCPPQGDVVTRVEIFRKTLADPAQPKAERRRALRFLVHFIQDLHQPVHVGHRDDRGGNDLQLQFFDEPTNLHRIWDYAMFEHESKDEDVWIGELNKAMSDAKIKEWSGKTVDAWADESLTIARSAYLIPNTKDELKSGSRLGQAYQDANLPPAKQRLAQATARLVEVLNEIWP